MIYDEKQVSFRSDHLSLEGRLAVPSGQAPFPAVIVCHPHPLYGGSMENNVVNALFDALAGASFVTLRFNFRGVGRSQGKYDNGIGEQDDVRGAISYIASVSEVDPGRLGLAGYSAGAAYSMPVGVPDVRIKALAAVSPPFSMFDFGMLRECPKPKLLISGSADSFVPAGEFLQFCQTLPEPRECASIEGADHFWWGLETELAARVVSFFTRFL